MGTLAALAVKAVVSGESLDELFRRKRPDLFSKFEGKFVPASEYQKVQRHIVPHYKHGGDGI